MSDNWQNLVIETGVDTVLNYLAENQKASVSEISNEIGVKQDRIKEWADALEQEGLIDKDYTVRSGLVLIYDEEHVEEMKDRRQNSTAIYRTKHRKSKTTQEKKARAYQNSETSYRKPQWTWKPKKKNTTP